MNKPLFLKSLGFALSVFAPETLVDSISYISDPDGFECAEIRFVGGYSRGVEISGLATAAILRWVTEVIESKEVRK